MFVLLCITPEVHLGKSTRIRKRWETEENARSQFCARSRENKKIQGFGYL